VTAALLADIGADTEVLAEALLECEDICLVVVDRGVHDRLSARGVPHEMAGGGGGIHDRIVRLAQRYDIRAAAISEEGDPARLTATLLRMLGVSAFYPSDFRGAGSSWARAMVRRLRESMSPGSAVPCFSWGTFALPRLLPLLSPSVKRLLLVGGADPDASSADEALLAAGREVFRCSAVEEAPGNGYDAVVFLAPFSHDAQAEKRLGAARSMISPEGSIVAACRNGEAMEVAEAFYTGLWMPPRPGGMMATPLDGYSRLGVDILLSRAGLERDRIETISFPGMPHWGWAVSAKRRPERLGNYGRTQQRKREIAEEANRMGEALFAAGDAMGAVKTFVFAVRTWDRNAVYLNNLATALHALGRFEDAWDRLLEGLHLDPENAALRANLADLAVLLRREKEARRLLALFPIA